MCTRDSCVLNSNSSRITASAHVTTTCSFLTFVIGLPLTAVFATRAAVAAVAALAARAVYQQFEHSRKSDAQKK